MRRLERWTQALERPVLTLVCLVVTIFIALVIAAPLAALPGPLGLVLTAVVGVGVFVVLLVVAFPRSDSADDE